MGAARPQPDRSMGPIPRGRIERSKRMNTRKHSRLRICQALAVCLWAATACGYRNPLMNVGNAAGYAADPCVLKWMGKYYLYHTDNYHVFESSDLVNWTDVGRWTPTNL